MSVRLAQSNDFSMYSQTVGPENTSALPYLGGLLNNIQWSRFLLKKNVIWIMCYQICVIHNGCVWISVFMFSLVHFERYNFELSTSILSSLSLEFRCESTFFSLQTDKSFFSVVGCCMIHVTMLLIFALLSIYLSPVPSSYMLSTLAFHVRGAFKKDFWKNFGFCPN